MMQYLLKHRIVSPQNYAHYHDVWIYQIKQLLLLCCRLARFHHNKIELEYLGTWLCVHLIAI